MRQLPHSLTTAEIHSFLGIDDPLILEIGANDGEDTARFLAEFPSAKVFCFDPDPRPLARFLRSPHAQDPRCHLTVAAIGDVDGMTRLHLSGGEPPTGIHPDERQRDWDMSSSICRPTGHLQYSPWCTFDREIEVASLRLDTWMESHLELSVIDFIWADVQGAEPKLIRGGRKTFQRVRWFFTEFYNSPMYEGQLCLAELAALLPAFELLVTYGGDNALFRNRGFDD